MRKNKSINQKVADRLREAADLLDGFVLSHDL